jgi:hypothetical protein
MINISQIEKFSQYGVPSRLLFSGEAATPKAFSEIGGKNYLLGGKPVEFPFTVSCGNKTGERETGRSGSHVGLAPIILSPKE